MFRPLVEFDSRLLERNFQLRSGTRQKFRFFGRYESLDDFGDRFGQTSAH